ncbi:CCA tRNA nucleotidyltransferase [Halococcoides cellulosivorans]|uniref:CCA-adding enzyme n=1 Tax=Halococcoides cellulosivorans TaxID=1679096 RepID=A0A2R4X2G4_9EURY|nr:CCA tRNA nucleotidyltransferase [Halococcoides cellulosivorans]AWB27964.1 CCA tRNA nucleotidyltransferase [Halococcoides cellulosivorans]
MDDDVRDVLDTVRERVTPDPDQRERLEAVRDDIVERTRRALAEQAVDGDVVLVGSTARGTWLPGDRDIDVFVRVPADIDRAELERQGLAIGRTVLPDGREEYAEHPYVTGTIDGFDVDIVPCYDVPSASAIRSAVDRTPFHTTYLRDRLDDRLATDVRVCKQFLRAIGAYGSDLRTQGFSGYLTELLVLEYDGVDGLFAAAADWHPPERFDPVGHGRFEGTDPLVVIDPTDPERNVAAATTAENVARFQHYVRRLLADPDPAHFEVAVRDPMDRSAVAEAFERRGTTPVALQAPRPDVVEDTLYPQLEKSRTNLADELDRRGFELVRSMAVADADVIALIFEVAVEKRPAVERHVGPPVAVREHAERFVAAYRDRDVTGPFLDGDRYVVEREREYRTAAALLDSDAIADVGLGSDVAAALSDRSVLVGPDPVAGLADRFGAELAAYLDPRP